ncbi:MAG TPA: hypothetical protein VE029_09665 [Rhizobacter sp.]|nr:hypothetical protein [Rhizobacter sp.]
MKLFGITLRKPSFNEITAAAVMGVGLWLACLGVMNASGQPMGRMDAGAALLVVVWACVAVRLGINVSAGVRHLAVNALVSAALLVVYQGAWALAS